MKFPKRRSLSIKTILNITLYLIKSFISGDDPGYQGKPYKSYCKKLEKYCGQKINIVKNRFKIIFLDLIMVKIVNHFEI